MALRVERDTECVPGAAAIELQYERQSKISEVTSQKVSAVEVVPRDGSRARPGLDLDGGVWGVGFPEVQRALARGCDTYLLGARSHPGHPESSPDLAAGAQTHFLP